MNNDFIYIYIIVHIFYLISASYIFLKINSDVMRKSEYTFFRIFISVYVNYLFFSAIWSLQEYKVINMPNKLFYVVCFFTMYSVVMNGLFFYVFTMIRILPEFAHKKINRYISMIPAIFNLVLMLISIRNGMIFTVTADNHVVYERYYFFIPVVTSIYLLNIFIVSLVKTIRSTSYIKKKEYMTLAMSIVLIAVFVVIDAQFDKTTVLPMAIFTVIFFIFVNIQESSIYTDALTNMNNRRKANEYLAGRLEGVSEAEPLYIYMCDVNAFKHINDKYGHDEGDKALIIISNVLKRVISKYDGFTARYGGDEFIFARSTASGDSPDNIIKDIEKTLSEECSKYNKPYDLSVSIGYVKCTNPSTTLASYVKEADEKMYNVKKGRY